MKLFKYKKLLAFLCAAILLFTFLSIPSSAYSNFVDYDDSQFLYPYSIPLRQDCPVPIDLNYYYSYTVVDSYASVSYLVSTTLLPFVSEDLVSSIGISSFRNSFTDHSFYGSVAPIDFNVESFSSDPSLYFIGTADFNYKDIYLLTSNSYEKIYTGFISFSLRDFYCWDYSFDSRLNFVDSEISLSFDLEHMDLPLHSIEVYYSLAGDTQLNYIKFDASNYPGILTGDITFTPDMFGYSGDSIVYIYSADVIFWNGLNQSYFNDLIILNFDAHYVFNPYLHNVNYAGSPGGSLPLANYTSWIADAASGFLDFQIYDGFTLGGIFMCIIAFLCAMWFLKLVAGG